GDHHHGKRGDALFRRRPRRRHCHGDALMDPISAALSLAAFAAPRLGRWLFGADGETVATQMVSAARQITGTGTAEDAAAALRADPALLTQFQIQMATLEGDLERAYLADRQSARLRDIELAKAGRHNARADLM